MDKRQNSKPPIDFEEGPDKPSKSAFKISGLAIAIAAVICIGFIVVVVMQKGGL